MPEAATSPASAIQFLPETMRVMVSSGPSRGPSGYDLILLCRSPAFGERRGVSPTWKPAEGEQARRAYAPTLARIATEQSHLVVQAPVRRVRTPGRSGQAGL